MILAARALWIDHLDRLHLLTPMRILLMLLAALAATMFCRVLVSRLVQRIPHVGDRTRADQRGRTLSTVLRSTLIALIWLIVVVTVLGELGVNIGAFVATATIIGGALAFGAQTLVRDVIAGFFVIAEDQYGVGDVVDLGLADGTVEQVTLRSTRVRNADGTVWFVPNGQIVRVANMSQDFATATLDVVFDRHAHVEETLAALRQTLDDVGHEGVLARPSVLGVQSVGDDRYTVRVSTQCRPGQSDDVLRKLRAIIVTATQQGTLPQPPPVPPVGVMPSVE